MSPQRESFRRLITTDEKCLPRPHHRSAALHAPHDRALNAAADCDILRNHAAIDRCAIADQEIGSAQLAFNSAEDLSRTIAFDLAYDRHAGADARVRSRFRRRWLRP